VAAGSSKAICFAAYCLTKSKRAGAAYDAKAFVAGAGALRILELGLDVVAIIIALPSEDSTGICFEATIPLADSLALPPL